LVGDNGQDTQKGGESNDAYYFGPGWGKDSISDRTGANRLVFHGAPIGGLPVTEDLTIKLVSGDGPEVTNANGSSTILTTTT
jgi:hypothetical protein